MSQERLFMRMILNYAQGYSLTNNEVLKDRFKFYSTITLKNVDQINEN
jgi:hypothetical protein